MGMTYWAFLVFLGGALSGALGIYLFAPEILARRMGRLIEKREYRTRLENLRHARRVGIDPEEDWTPSMLYKAIRDKEAAIKAGEWR
jgi:hypothetical protein